MVRIASFNVENLFARPKVFNTTDWSIGRSALNAYKKVNVLFSNPVYSDADKQQILDLLIELDIYYINRNGATRRKRTNSPRWAWLRKNRGKFDRQPKDSTKSIEIIANSRDDWIGWVELAKEPTNEIGTHMTARVIRDISADIIGIVEAEDRPSLVRFNKEMLGELYKHVMLVDGNDERGIDVGIMMRNNFELESIQSNVDAEDSIGTIFSRDCPQYEVRTPNGTVIHLLVNHFKSQSGGGGEKRQRQAKEVRKIVNELVAQGKHVIVLGDLNEGPAVAGSQAENLIDLFNNDSPLVDCYWIPDFQIGNRPGTFDSCSLRKRFDYVLISQSLRLKFMGGGVFRKGLWGSRKTRPTAWSAYQDMTKSVEQASDHAAVFVDLNI
jgi:endonuclease/exonuclease/phosphatase family metal-dependent hydrolase